MREIGRRHSDMGPIVFYYNLSPPPLKDLRNEIISLIRNTANKLGWGSYNNTGLNVKYFFTGKSEA